MGSSCFSKRVKPVNQWIKLVLHKAYSLLYPMEKLRYYPVFFSFDIYLDKTQVSTMVVIRCVNKGQAPTLS